MPKDPIQSIVTRAIDLNRYSNKVSNDILALQNRVWVDTLNQLQNLSPGQESTYNAQRLRGILKQTRETIRSAGAAGEAILIEQMQGLAESETKFIEKQLQLAIAGGTIDGRTIGKTLSATEVPASVVVNSVEVPPNFARVLVSQSPSDIPLVLRRDKAKTLAQEAIDAPVTLNLRTPLGTELAATLDGTPIVKRFRALTESSADFFDRQVTVGLAEGQTIGQIQKRLLGKISYVGDRTFLQKGAQLEAKSAQIKTLVRTSVATVNNTAAQSVYQANQHITRKYKFVATLDSRSCKVCGEKDQKIFKYGNGPTPAIHPGCRCCTVAEISYAELGITPPADSTRASADGQVPASLNYEEWLKKQPKGEVEKILGKGKADLFLSNKIRIADIVRTDTSEVTLAQLQKSVESGAIEKRLAKEETAKPLATIPSTPEAAIAKGREILGKEREDELDRLSREWADLRRQRDDLRGDMDSNDSDIRVKATGKYFDLRKLVLQKGQELNKKMDDFRSFKLSSSEIGKKEADRLAAQVNFKQSVDKVTNAGDKKYTHDKPVLKNAISEFLRFTNWKDSDQYFKEVFYGSERAYADIKGLSINIGKATNDSRKRADVMFHEMGHLIESNNNSVFSLCEKFRKSRATGSIQKLSKITGNNTYRDDEVGYPGRYLTPYVGKIYSSQATEVLSVGLEQMADFDTMSQLYIDDKEYFLFILGAI